MGAAASVNEIKQTEDQAIIDKMSEFYSSDPERAQRIINQATKKATGDIKPPAAAQSPEEYTETETTKNILEIINKVRADPQSFVPAFQERLGRYDGKVLKREGKPNLLTDEGVDAVQDCITYLGSLSAVPPLTLAPGLCLAARDHVTDIGASGTTSHTGADGSSMQDRIERYGEWTDLIGENICFAEDTPMDIVLSMLVDDAVKSRGHRKNIFNDRFKTVGIEDGPHTKFRHVCVITFSGEYGPKVQKLRTEKTVEAQGEMTDDLKLVLASIPFPEIKEAVMKAIGNPEIKIVMNYKPGSIEARITENATTNVLSGTWSTSMQPL
uniref:SCP domain-containing protein n=1 Tax=Fibrocapsa japonica TaxID=94617 RepID=A0A7S2UZA8_9STRA